eukprot:5584670-Pyramimonas_sp.AAC.1
MSVLQWIDPRNGSAHTLRVRHDLPIDVRDRQRTMSRIYQPILDLLRGHQSWTHECKLGVNGFKGEMMVVTPQDAIIIVKLLKRSESAEESYAVKEELNLWGISAEQIQQVFNVAHKAGRVESYL